MVFEKCRELLLAESELVQQIAALQKLVRNAVEQREWADFEGYFKTMNALGNELAAREKEREALFENGVIENSVNRTPLSAGLAGGDKGRFYSLTAGLPPPQRAELGSIYRSLKLETLRLRMSNDTLTAYLSEARSTITGFFEAAFPDRGGRMYTQHGIPLSHDMRSMVLNRTF